MVVKKEYVNTEGYIVPRFYDGWYCPNCNHHMYRDTPYCDNCGNRRDR